MRENKKKKRREGDIGNVKKKCKGECDIEEMVCWLSGLNRMNESLRVNGRSLLFEDSVTFGELCCEL